LRRLQRHLRCSLHSSSLLHLWPHPGKLAASALRRRPQCCRPARRRRLLSRPRRSALRRQCRLRHRSVGRRRRLARSVRRRRLPRRLRRR
jgi:hypothetical protein